MKNYIIIGLFCVLVFGCAERSKNLHIQGDYVTIIENDRVISESWLVDPELSVDVIEVECKKAINEVLFTDGKDSVKFLIKEGDKVDFHIIKNNQEKALTRIVGIKPILNFTEEYINENKDKTIIEIPEVSELANILVALHKDAQKDRYMTHSITEYFKRVKQHFAPYTKHPIMDTIQKYIGGLRYIESINDSLFSNESYSYYYSLKMNACAFKFDKNRNIVNKGYVRDMAYSWFTFNAMKDSALMSDFAKTSNFKAFYEQEKPYYESLIKTYKTLNPISQMKTWLDKKFDFTYDNFTIYFSPLVHGSHSTQRFEDNGFTQTIMFIAKAEFNKNLSTVQNILNESRLVFTEIDHNYVNPTSDRFLETIDKMFSNKEDWLKGEVSSAYESPYEIFNEYMTFGLFTLYAYDHYSVEDLELFLPKMESLMVDTRGFYRFKEFNEELLNLYKKLPDITADAIYEAMLNSSTISKIKTHTT